MPFLDFYREKPSELTGRRKMFFQVFLLLETVVICYVFAVNFMVRTLSKVRYSGLFRRFHPV